jgi:orotate phosphoribosyltransferase
VWNDPSQKNNLNRLKELLLNLSYEEREVVLASGEKSNFYFDGKQTSLNAEGSVLLGEVFFAMMQSLPVPIAAVGGPTLGADPLVTAVSLTSFLKNKPIPAFIIRKEPKKHGTAQWIEGIKNLKTGMRVMILEDVVTSGKSSLEAVDKAKSHGLDVYGILAIVDREEQEGAAKIRAQGLHFDSIFKKADLLKR